MDEDDSLVRLQGLQADLVAFSESRLPNVERLWAELESSIEDFQRLLDRQQKNDKSRQTLKSGTRAIPPAWCTRSTENADSPDAITIDDVQYGINEEFRQDVIQVADELDLDELDAAKLYLQSQDTALEIDRPPALASVFRFHGHNETLLQSLRLSVQQAVELDLDHQHRAAFVQLVRLVVRPKGQTDTQDDNQNHAQHLSTYWRKCLNTMLGIEQWLQRLNDRLQSASVIGQTAMAYALEALEFERDSLTKQHESLGAIVCHLLKESGISIDDFRFLMNRTAALERLDDLTLHYVPVLICCASYIGPVDSQFSLREARGLDQYFADVSDTTRWRMPDFRAAMTICWLAEYSGRYIDNHAASPLIGVNVEAENEARSERFMSAIRGEAFEFMLLVCSQVRANLWHDPAKADLVNFLLAGAERARNHPLRTSEYFQDLLAQNMQLFVDAFISNMPDTIRKLKYDEDEQRRNLIGNVRQPQGAPEYALHLERFLLIISYAFQGFPEAAQSFWQDPDGNLYGFFQWASKRQSTPRVAAFCEMFQSIAEDQECADAGHRFLKDEVTTTTARLRRGAPLSWSQIINELAFYALDPVKGRTLGSSLQADNALLRIVEPESELMLECYLRLTSHMCKTSPEARKFIIEHETINLHEILLDLVKKTTSTRLRACCYTALGSMLYDKVQDSGIALWDALDGWMFDAPPKGSNISKAATLQNNAIMSNKGYFESIAVGFDEPNAFTSLLQILVSPSAEQNALADTLPFSEQLGMAYRMPGIDQYVDFVLGRVFKDRVLDLPDINQVWELRCTCLDFIATCLTTFNEDLVIFANSTNLPVDSAINTSTLAAYVRLHPFARVMEWLFNDGVAAALFASARESIDIVSVSAPGSPRITALCRSIQVIDLVLKLQSTYFDVVRPVVKMQSVAKEPTVANPALASFEDVILTQIDIIVDLGLYCGTGHPDLTNASLQLLQRLATARKLSIASGAAHAGSRVLSALQREFDVDRVAAAFIAPLQLNGRELEMGVAGPGVSIKQSILNLLNGSLDAASNRPALAHCLLGFRCSNRGITIPPDGLFAKGGSLFHAVAKLSSDTISLPESNALLWLSSIRRTSCQILHKLVRSPLTERIIIDELREMGYSDLAAVAQQPIGPENLWCGRTCADPEFLLSDAAPVFRDFLIQRAAYFEGTSLDIRSTVQRNSPTLRQRIMSSLLGITTLDSMEQVQHVSIFEMFDFVDLEIALPFQLPEPRFIAGVDFGICRTNDSNSGFLYDLKLVKELLLLREAELRKAGKLYEAEAQRQIAAESDAAMLCLQSENEYTAIMAAQRSALNAWVQLVSLVLAMGDFEAVPKTALVLQALQIVLPKLDKTIAEDSPITLPLAKLTYTLVRAADAVATVDTREGNAANDRLVHAFRTSLRGIASSAGSVELRETCYQIIRHFLKSTTLGAGTQAALQRQSTKIIEHGGERLVDTICEDALSSHGTCRISALLVLEACVQLFCCTKSAYMIRSLTRLNFTSVLVDSIRGIAAEFQQQQPGQGEKLVSASATCATVVLIQTQDPSALLSYIHTSLTVLLRMSQTPEGCSAILEAGLFSSIRDSQLFAADPDIGLDVDNAEALENFYRLLTAMVRIIISVVVTKGPRNKHVLAQGRNFLVENRTCMQGVFKAATRSDKLPVSGREALEELVDVFMVLIHTTGFLEVSSYHSREARKC